MTNDVTSYHVTMCSWMSADAVVMHGILTNHITSCSGMYVDAVMRSDARHDDGGCYHVP